MASLKDAASLINELSQDTQLELYKSWQHNQEAAVSRLVEIAQEKGKAGYDAETVKRLIEEFIADVQKNDENEDLELREGELASVSGGDRGSKWKSGDGRGKYLWQGTMARTQQDIAWKNAEEEQEKQRGQRQNDIDGGGQPTIKNLF